MVLITLQLHHSRAPDPLLTTLPTILLTLVTFHIVAGLLSLMEWELRHGWRSFAGDMLGDESGT